MNGLVLLIPFLLIRFGLLSFLNRDAVKRAAFFAPVIGQEVPAYWLYQISNVFIFVYVCFRKIVIDSSWVCYAGVISYALGLVLCTVSIINFAAPCEKGFHDNGLYRCSRNPMYLAYFIFFIGCALLIQSVLFTIVIFVFIISSHWIILSEERWCIKEFGGEYRKYMERVGRYLWMI